MKWKLLLAAVLMTAGCMDSGMKIKPVPSTLPITTIQSTQTAECTSYFFVWGAQGAPTTALQFGTLPVTRNGFYIGNDNYFGLYPYFNNGVALNGGIPQAVNMAAHLAKVESDVNYVVPDPEFAGAISLEGEYWDPRPDFWNQWAQEWFAPYRAASKARVHAAHPTWSDAQIDTQAKTEFFQAGLNFMVQTVLKIRELRPHAQVGYYNFPFHVYFDGYFSATNGAAYQALDDQLNPLWEVQTAVFPETYQFYRAGIDATAEANADYIRQMTLEGVRVARGKPVYNFNWYRYHHGAGIPGVAGTFLNEIDLRQSLTLPLQYGAAGVIIWGYEPSVYGTNELQNYMNATMTEVLTDFAAAHNLCAP